MASLTLDPSHYRDIVRRALAEDLGPGDVTTGATVAATSRARGVFLAASQFEAAFVSLAHRDADLEAAARAAREALATLR